MLFLHTFFVDDGMRYTMSRLLLRKGEMISFEYLSSGEKVK